MFESQYVVSTSSSTSASTNVFCLGAVVGTNTSAQTGTGIGINSRKLSMSESQQLPALLQQLANGYFPPTIPDEKCPLCFRAKRHQETIEGIAYERQPWRIRERMKTASVALVLCLNIGVDPPDVVKIQPCARLECWIDPSSVSAPKAMELIGANLQMQYERWQPRARYKKCHDPTVDDVKKLCTSLRRNAKGERILFHYNGHGVPKPTANGEIWVFNKTFTQYIPLSIFELQSWMAAPSIYVYDCSNAGIIINSFQQFAEQHERDLDKALATAQKGGGGATAAASSNQVSATAAAAPNTPQLPLVSYKNCIHLAACSVNEILPMNAQLPADLFTSCLTTPINIALKWYTMQEKFELVPRTQSDLIDKIPGKVNDRRTMMGELNWIFTAITDTIAWNSLPRELFQKLFRQDLLVASLFRNFLLAERILRSHDCTPVSHPALPMCFRHPMWISWDLVVDLALQQLPDILEKGAPYKQLPFFEEQLTAFQVWLDRESESRSPPEQLPIVLQVLLSQVHRLRALELLARFLDLGPWAVNLALGVGIFPYVLKLLQSSAKELRPVLVFIWAKILAVDNTCQVDLVKDNKYFLAVLQDNTISKEHRTLSAFVLACVVNNFLLGQTSALQGSLVSVCLVQLNDENWLLRQWLAICLGMLWQNFDKARWSGVRDLAHEKLYPLLRDEIPEVRAAAVFALGTFISSVTDRSEEHANNIDRIIAITLLETVGEDMSPLVRLELVAALQWMVLLFESQFVNVYMQDFMSATSVSSSAAAFTTCASERSVSISHSIVTAPTATAAVSLSSTKLHHSTHSLERNVTMRRGVSSSSISNMAATNIPFYSIFLKLWHGIYNLGNDPFPKVATTAQHVIAYVRDAALCLITAKEATSTEKCISLSVSLPPSPNTRTNYLEAEASPNAGAVTQRESQQTPAVTSWASKLRNNPLLGGSGNGGGGAGDGGGVIGAGGRGIAGVIDDDPQTILQRKLRTSSMNDETDSSSYPVGSKNNPPVSGRGGEPGITTSARSSSSDTNFETKTHAMKPIITTDFIPWAISYFTRPGKHRYTPQPDNEGQQIVPVDENSPEQRRRQYRFQRNHLVRHKAREQQAAQTRIDSQIWMGKTQFTPSIVKLLHYENQIAFAYKEKVSVYDWSNNTTRSFTPLTQQTTNKSAAASTATATQAPPIARVSAIEFLNAHDVDLVLAGHEDGMVRIWQQPPSYENPQQQQESKLLTAWEALSLNPTPLSIGITSSMYGVTASTKQRKDNYGLGLVTAWQQCSEQLVVGGGACRFLRIWDVHRELKLSDLLIGADTTVRVIASFLCNVNSNLITTGCADGSVRLFDKRCAPQEARIRVYREHSSPILTVSPKVNQTTLITGCTQGKVCVLDMRSRGPSAVLHQWDVGADVMSIAGHQSADVVACGSAHRITIYNQNGRSQSVLRSNEGFMGQKIGHPSYLSFHAYKSLLAVGFVDNTVAVYGPASVL